MLAFSLIALATPILSFATPTSALAQTLPLAIPSPSGGMSDVYRLDDVDTGGKGWERGRIAIQGRGGRELDPHLVEGRLPGGHRARCLVERASDALQHVLDELAEDPQWSASITEPPRILSVDSISSTGVVLRAWVKTAPGKMFMLSREINRRVRAAFSKSDISMGMPTSRVFRNEPTAPPEEPA